jgi:hypothetical protein
MIRRLHLGATALICALAASIVPTIALAQTGQYLLTTPDNGVTKQIVGQNTPLPTQSLPTAAAVASFQQTCTTSAAPLTSATYTNGYVITASSSNTGTVYIGGSTVTTSTGYPLSPGQSISYGAANSNQAYMICANTTDKVAVTGN